MLRSLGRRHGTGALGAVAGVVADVGFASWNVDLIIGDTAERDEDLAATLDDVLSLDVPAAARERLRAHARAGHPARRRPRPAPRRRRRGTPLRDGRRAPHAARATGSRRSPTGRCRATRRGTTGSTGPRASTPGWAARRTATSVARGPGTCALRSATASSWPCGRDPTAGTETLDERDASASRRSRCCCARGSACPKDAFDDLDALGDLVERRRRPRRAHACADACSRTR